MPYLWFPATFAAAIAGFAGLLSAGVPLAVATYTPIAAAALAVVALELTFPERLDWRPRRGDVAADAAFMACVQVLLPRVLAATAVLALAAWTHEHAPSPWWPHAWPLGVQMVMMVLAVDFLRYWLHRACHTYAPLWRLHEVHHSPEVLYTLNVGRFHPLEFVAGVPFSVAAVVFFGVPPAAVIVCDLAGGALSVFHHANLRIPARLERALRWIIVTPDLHRIHHSSRREETDSNFGVDIPLWDHLFGTYRGAPRDSAALGLKEWRGAQSRSLMALLANPFR